MVVVLYKNLKNECGFLLADSVIAILIMSVALLSCMGVVISSLKATRVSAGYTAAIYLAQKQAEILKGTKDPSDWAAMYETNSFMNTTETEEVNGITYTIATKAGACPETQTMHTLVEVTIDLTWRETDGEHRYQLLTAYPAVTSKST